MCKYYIKINLLKIKLLKKYNVVYNTKFIMNHCDFDSDSDDERDEFTEEIIEELILYNKLRKINKFKHHIKKEPEFFGIDKIADVCILSIIHLDDKATDKKLSKYQVSLFEDLYKNIDVIGTVENYEFVYKKIRETIMV